MEEMIIERFRYHIETNELLKNYLSRFSKRRGKTYPVLCFRNEMREAQMNKESLVAIFLMLGMVLVYGIIWKQSLIIKLS